MSKPFYITTAIDYVNGQPHLGHAYEKVVTDVIARARRSMGQEVFFLTGLDEHGQKVQQAAQAEGKTSQAYCDGLAADWKRFASTLELTNNDFIRTTEPRHKAVVQAVLQRLHERGHFYSSEYSGWYSTRAETFLTDKDRRPDGTFDPEYGDVVQLKEQNYYFKLKEHQAWLIDYIEKNPGFISPDYRRNEVLGFLKNNDLEDLCISRPESRLTWGIPLPFDPGYVTYVWFDALTNYVTIPAALGDPSIPDWVRAGLPEPVAAGSGPSLWPADVHVIGKDILKFHAVYWPIMLKAAELPLPHRLLVHGWWQKDGQKMSKSTGITVDPVKVVADWGLDAFRYYVVRELDLGPDGNWTDSGFESRYNAELANGLGNLVNRALSMLKKYRNGVVPARHDELAPAATAAIQAARENYETFRLQAALVETWSLVTRANQYVDQTAPFRLAKDPAQAGRLDEVLYNLVEVCRLLAILVSPVIPQTAQKIFKQLALPGSPDRFADAVWGGMPSGHSVGDVAALFPRRDQPPK